jgi:hypothetical protein
MRKVDGLGCGKGVVAAPAVDQNHRATGAVDIFVVERDAVPMEERHAVFPYRVADGRIAPAAPNAPRGLAVEAEATQAIPS